MSKNMVVGLVIAAVIMFITLISIKQETKVGVCAYGNCPKETHFGNTYCYTHKCDNTTCDNKKPYGSSYCDECIERGKNK